MAPYNAFRLQHSNDSYENGRLRELQRLADFCERLKAAGINDMQLIRSGKRPHDVPVSKALIVWRAR